MHGFVLDEKGRKMSKSLGNIIEPKEVTDRYGVDAFRLYMMSTNPLWEDLKFSWKGVEVNHRALTILWNVHMFATTYMSLDGFNPKKIDQEWISVHLQPEDKWMLSRTNTLIKDVTSALERFNIHVAARILSSFILEDLSRWYVKLVRERVWIEKDDPRKLAAYVTLYQALHVLCRLLAPFVPHVSEAIYRDLVRGVDERAPESVYMLPWPHFDERVINKKLEDGMSLVRKFVDAGAAARQKAKLKLRWPVNEIRIKPASPDKKALLGDLEQILKHRLNCKTLTILNPEDQLVQAGEPSERFSIVSTDAGELAVDIQLTPELRAECLARELIRRLQMMRNELNLQMEEKVDVAIGAASSENLKQLESQRELICREVRILNLDLCPIDEVREEGHLREWDIGGTHFKLLMRREKGVLQNC
jgi:isoleucyl-tRNA synthetase